MKGRTHASTNAIKHPAKGLLAFTTLLITMLLAATPAANAAKNIAIFDKNYKIQGYQKTAEWWTSYDEYADKITNELQTIRRQTARATEGDTKAKSNAFTLRIAELYPQSRFGWPECFLHLSDTTEVVYNSEDLGVNRIVTKQDGITRTYTFKVPLATQNNEQYNSYEVTDGYNTASFIVYADPYDPEFSYFDKALIPDADQAIAYKMNDKVKPTTVDIYNKYVPNVIRTVNGYTAAALNILYLNNIGPKGTYTMADIADGFVTNTEFRRTVVASIDSLEQKDYESMLWQRPESAPLNPKLVRKNNGNMSDIPLPFTQKQFLTEKNLGIPRVTGKGALNNIIFTLVITATLIIVTLLVKKLKELPNPIAPARKKKDKDDQSTAHRQPKHEKKDFSIVYPASRDTDKVIAQAIETPPDGTAAKKQQQEHDSYTVRAMATGCGIITPGVGTFTYKKGSTPNFVISPEAGHQLLEVRINGVPQGPITEFTFQPLDSDQTIQAFFHKIPTPEDDEPHAKPPKKDMKLTVLALAALSTAALASATPAWAGDGSPTTGQRDQIAVAVTIYNVNLGLVKDQRSIALPAGRSELRFMDVASQIIPASVHIKSLSDPDSLDVLEQNYEYDLLNPQKILDKYVGREVVLYQKNPYTEREETLTATLLSNNGGPIFKIGGDITFGHPGRIIFPGVPENLISKPTLLWLLDNRLPTEQTVEASYLTNNINWRADYVMTMNDRDDAADLNGWVTIDNKSGTTYRDAMVKLVAGDVNRVKDELQYAAKADRAAGMARAAEPQFREESFFEYHIYTLQRPSTIKDNQTKQISLITATGIPLKKELMTGGAKQYYHGRYAEPMPNQKVGVYVEALNKKENRLGIPLPKGTVRVYKRDTEGSLQFIGEDAIDHTPKDEKIRIKLGEAFDVVATRKQTDWKKVAYDTYEAAFQISIRNHKDEDVTVKVIEPIPGDWTMIQTSHQYKKTEAFTAEFSVPVQKDKESALNYRVRMRY